MLGDERMVFKSRNYSSPEKLSLNQIILFQINECREWGTRAGLGGVNDAYIPGFANSIDMLEILSQKYLEASNKSKKKLAKLRQDLNKGLDKIVNSSKGKRQKKVEVLMLQFENAKERFRVLMDALSKKIEGVKTTDEI